MASTTACYLPLASLFLVAACSDGAAGPADAMIGESDAPPGGCSGFVGDPGQPIEVEIVILDVAGTASTVSDGARVPLIRPDQGGEVIFAGVRARNLDTCAVMLIGSLRDGTEATDPIVGLDGRPVNLADAGDGWAEASEPMQVSSYTNIPPCPNFVSSRDIHEQPYQLTLSVRDGNQRRGSRSVMVTPYCAEPRYETDCLRICKQGYRM